MDLEKMKDFSEKIKAMREQAETLAAEGPAFPALWRNSLRILACIRLMEIGLGQTTGE